MFHKQIRRIALVGQDQYSPAFDRLKVAVVFLGFALKTVGQRQGPVGGGNVTPVDLPGELLISHHARRPRMIALVGAGL